jgi:DNA polymerase-3 subunit gamma/tau
VQAASSSLSDDHTKDVTSVVTPKQAPKPAAFDLSAAFLNQQQAKADDTSHVEPEKVETPPQTPTAPSPALSITPPTESPLEQAAPEPTQPESPTVAAEAQEQVEASHTTPVSSVAPPPLQHQAPNMAAEVSSPAAPPAQASSPEAGHAPPSSMNEPPIEAYFDDMPPPYDDVPPPWHQDEPMQPTHQPVSDPMPAPVPEPQAPNSIAVTSDAPTLPAQQPSTQPDSSPAPAPVPAQKVDTVSVEGAYSVDEWVKIIEKLDVTGFAGELARNSVLLSNEKGAAQLLLSPNAVSMNTPANVDRMQTLLSDYFQRPIKLEVVIGNSDIETPAQQTVRHDGERQQGAVDSILHDPLVQQFQQHFGARVIQEAIRPVTVSTE